METKLLFNFDCEIRKSKQEKYLVGIDEAGKGALAGPLYISGVCFLDDYYDSFINDSKLLKPLLREKVYKKLIKADVIYKTIKIENKLIDEIGLNDATYLAVQELLEYFHKKLKSCLFLADFSPIYKRFGNYPILNLKKGDRKSYHIAAASIIAKVSRDKEMVEWNKSFPTYSFDKNKGYGTKYHINKIRTIGHCSLHRQTFKIKNLNLK